MFSLPTEPLDFTFYQCSGCGYTSPTRHHVTTHVSAVAACRSKRSSVLSQRCACSLMPAGTKAAPAQQHSSVHIDGDHNYNVINQIVVNVHPMAYSGSEEERQALFGVFKDTSNLKELATLEPEEIPAAVFRMWKGVDAPEALKNIKVVGNRVEEQRGPDQVVSVPRTKFVRRTVSDMLDAVVKAPKDESDVVAQVSNTLQTKDLKLGKKRCVSRYEAAKMHASGSKGVYDLNPEARQFLDDSKRMVDRELDYYAADTNSGATAAAAIG